MQRRDTKILLIAVICGLAAFLLVLNSLNKPTKSVKPVHQVTKVKSQSLEIPADMRALTLSGKDVENFPSPLEVGNFVDIIGIAPNYANQMELQTIVRSSQVVKIDRGKEGEQSAIHAITLTLSPVGAEVVTKAKSEGKVQLVLRPDGGDRDVLQLGSVGFVEVIKGVQKQKNMNVT